MSSSPRLLQAACFAANKHSSQKRKGSGEPYIIHPLGVAELLASVGGIDDVDILVAAILHDTVEDTDTTLDEIENLFGSRVRDIVAEVTDNKSISKAKRKQLQVKYAPHKSREAKLVKLADKLYNLRDLLHFPIWEAPGVQGYFVWAARVIDGLRGTNAPLEAELDSVLQKQFEIEEVSYPALPSLDHAEQEAFLQGYYASLAPSGYFIINRS